MSGKFNSDDYIPRFILLGKDNVTVLKYIDEYGYSTDIPFIVLVNKSNKECDVEKIALDELNKLGYDKYTVTDIELGNLDYDEYDEVFYRDGGNQILTETMWLVDIEGGFDE